MMRVLALVPGGVGDQLLFFPTLETLKQQYPQAAIDVVVEPRVIGAYKVCPSVRKVLTFDYKDRNSLADFGNLLGSIRDQEYNAVVSLGQRFSVRFLLWLTGIPQRVSFAGQGDYLLSQAVPLNTNQYAAAMYHDLLKGFDINVPCPPIKINVAKTDIDWATNEQKRLGITNGYILIHGGSSALAIKKGIDKIYPVDSWVAIAQDIQEKLPKLPIVILKGPEDAELVSKLTAKLPKALVISPPDIGKLAAVIAAANLLLCTDSAPMHLGVAVGTALVALFGPTSPEKLLPLNDPKIKFVKAPEGKPIAAIAPQDVLAKIWQD
ncbi:glycosyltransferase family 9 protein [Tumidithrix elongata RA019]|uniref:Glycosyltransferase family 9 protein n=2 Tax=Tumidithrix TaxID=3088355 RepID=A0AAW9Q8W5_9CYAN|nr:glycosyltransferase family 9 protein [Tumidithrix elongata RA019]